MYCSLRRLPGRLRRESGNTGCSIGRSRDRRTGSCLWVILIGLANFVVYSILYTFIGGEAVNGRVVTTEAGRRYFLQSGREVARWVFLYSGVHSISIWPTVAAVLLAMLTLAKERIVSSMRSTIIRGRTFITALATLIAFGTIVLSIWFILQFVRQLNSPTATPPTPAGVLR